MDDLYDENEDLSGRRRPKHANRVPDDVGEDIHRRMAAMMARRLRTQHDCTQARTGSCDHPNHRRDVDSLLSDDTDHPGALILLGLDDVTPGYTEAENRTWLRWIGRSGPAEEQAA